jgi:hypothetical protein
MNDLEVKKAISTLNGVLSKIEALRIKAESKQINEKELFDIHLTICKAIDLLSEVTEEVWEIEYVDRYWYWSSRYGKEYVEITYWFEPRKLLRKETKRECSIYSGNESSLPEWAKGINQNKTHLNDSRIY